MSDVRAARSNCKQSGIDPETFDKARELAPRVERGDANAIKEIGDYQKTRSAKQNNELLNAMEVDNIARRQLNNSLPRLIITNENGNRRFDHIDKTPKNPDVQEVPGGPKVQAEYTKAQIAARQVDRSSRPEPKLYNGEPTNTATGQEYVVDSTLGLGAYKPNPR